MRTLGNFSFLIRDQLAGSAHPGVGADLGDTLSELREHGIGAIMTLTEYPLDTPILREFGMANIHLPIQDFSAPTMEQIRQAMDFIRDQIKQNRAVLVHCFGGYGRTGTILACHLVTLGHGADEAIEMVRQARPGSIESAAQERVILAFAREWRRNQADRL